MGMIVLGGGESVLDGNDCPDGSEFVLDGNDCPGWWRVCPGWE